MEPMLKNLRLQSSKECGLNTLYLCRLVFLVGDSVKRSDGVIADWLWKIFQHLIRSALSKSIIIV